MKRRNAGFTLIELMLVVAIVAILATIALPSYQGYLVKTRRMDAMATLQEFANAMERYRLSNNTYIGADNGGVPGIADPAVFPAVTPEDGTAYYDLTIESLTLNTFTLRATPIAGKSQAGDGIIELDSTGARRWDEANDFPLWQAEDNNWHKQ